MQPGEKSYELRNFLQTLQVSQFGDMTATRDTGSLWQPELGWGSGNGIQRSHPTTPLKVIYFIFTHVVVQKNKYSEVLFAYLDDAFTYMFFSLCSGSSGHLHSGLVHWDYVRCGSNRSHAPHSLLHQEEPRGKIPRYGGGSSHSMSSNNTQYHSLPLLTV